MYFLIDHLLFYSKPWDKKKKTRHTDFLLDYAKKAGYDTTLSYVIYYPHFAEDCSILCLRPQVRPFL